MQVSDVAWRWLLRAFMMLAVATSWAPGGLARAPQRVVSMNLCTDQLAMLLAAPGQLVSVSHLAQDPTTSMMADAAKRYPDNHGHAEEVFMLRPDLVLAGSYTTKATIALLRRLRFRVEVFAPARSFDDIRDRVTRLGDLLGRRGRARSILATFEREIAALRRTVDDQSATGTPVAVQYQANGYTSGTGTLASEIVRSAGFENLGDRLGRPGMIRLPLETLVIASPDLLITSPPRWAAPALAYDVLAHPVLRYSSALAVSVPQKFWVCGTPFSLEAARRLQRAAVAGPLARGRR